MIVLGTTPLTFQNVTQGFAPINSPALINPTANTPPQFNSSQLLATTEFVQRALGSLSGFSPFPASRSLTVADIGKAIWPSAASLTLTLPTPASLGVPNGVAVLIFTTSVGVTLAAGAGASINSPLGSALSTFAVKLGQSLILIAAGVGTWQIVNSTADLGSNADFASVLGVSAASQQLPGLSIKVGNINNVSTAASLPLTFPVSFPVACIALILTGWSGTAAAYTHIGRDKSGATLQRGSNTNYLLDYIAIGF